MAISGVHTGNDPQLEAPEIWRKLLVSVAYKMLGSLAEAEDLASEVILNWLETNPTNLEDPKAYAVRMVINRSLNRLKVLKREREHYPGPWLPEPVTDPEIASEEFSIGLLRVMETLNPVERAVFILRNAFDYGFEAVSEFVDRSPENCRKILSRAKKKLAESRNLSLPRIPARHQVVEEILKGFEEKDFKRVFNWLHQEVVLWSDGGGKVTAAMVAVRGLEKVVAFLQNISSIPGRDISLKVRIINGQPGILVFDHGQLDSVMAFEFAGDKITELLIVRNPEKISHLFST